MGLKPRKTPGDLAWESGVRAGLMDALQSLADGLFGPLPAEVLDPVWKLDIEPRVGFDLAYMHGVFHAGPLTEIAASRIGKSVLPVEGFDDVVFPLTRYCDTIRLSGYDTGLHHGRLLLLEAYLLSRFGPLSAERLAGLRAVPDERLPEVAAAAVKALEFADVGL